MAWRSKGLQMRRTLLETSTNGGSIHPRSAHLPPLQRWRPEDIECVAAIARQLLNLMRSAALARRAVMCSMMFGRRS